MHTDLGDSGSVSCVTTIAAACVQIWLPLYFPSPCPMPHAPLLPHAALPSHQEVESTLPP